MHDLKELVQFIINGAISGSLLALLGVSFALIISVTGRFHRRFTDWMSVF
jgi:branched-subunit amino acid ABC-type transport system permease component